MHISVLLKETINNLNIKKDGIYVDCTLGYGGHSLEILKRLDKGYLYCFDEDIEIINYAQERLKDYHNFKIINDNYSNILTRLNALNLTKVDGIIYDLGLSSYQIDNKDRGFSYMNDARLDMRMNVNKDKDAYYVINNYSEEDLLRIFYTYGEEKYSKNIVRNILKVRSTKKIETTKELSDIIIKSVPYSYKGHPAKKVFQALRIEVNDELTNLEKSLKDALELLNISGRLCVITFHSLEDRIVKNIFNSKVKDNTPKDLPISLFEEKYKLITKKPIIPSEEEINNNSRSHSAKLRVIERIKL